MNVSLGSTNNITGALKTIDYNRVYRLHDRTVVLWHEIDNAKDHLDNEWVGCAIVNDSGEVVKEDHICKGADPQLIIFGERILLLSHICISDSLHRATLFEFEDLTETRITLRKDFIAQWDIADPQTQIYPFSINNGLGFFYSCGDGVTGAKNDWISTIASWTPGLQEMNFINVAEKLKPKENIFALDWIILQRKEKTIALARSDGKFFFHHLNLDDLSLGDRIIVDEGLFPFSDGKSEVDHNYKTDNGESNDLNVYRWEASIGKNNSVIVCAERGRDSTLCFLEFSLENGQGNGWRPYAFRCLMPTLFPIGSKYLITFIGKNGCIPDFWRDPDLRLAEIKSRELQTREEYELRKAGFERFICLYPTIWMGIVEPDGNPMGKPVRIHLGPVDSWGSQVAVNEQSGHVVWRTGNPDELVCQIMVRNFEILTS